MKLLKKFAISLLITVIMFSAFSLLAFSGLFEIIETRFYDQRVTKEIERELNRTYSIISEFHQKNIDRFHSILTLDSVKRVFLPNQSQEDIFRRDTIFENLKSEFPGILYVRFVDTKGNIHFSTYENDLLKRTDFNIVYKNLKEVDREIPQEKLILNEGEEINNIIDESRQVVIYQLPFYDNLGIYKGTVLFYLSTKSLRNLMLSRGILQPGQDFSLVHELGYVFYTDLVQNETLKREIKTEWESYNKGKEIVLLASTDLRKRFFLFTRYSEWFGFVGFVIPEDVFSISDSLKVILLAAFFITTFLIVFLLLNIKQDKLLVLSERVKRFQIRFLNEFIENKETVDWEKWQSELRLLREDVKNQIKRGLGKLKDREEESVDLLIDKSWDDIISTLTSMAERKKGVIESRIEIANLEQVIEKVLKKGRFALPVEVKGRTSEKRIEKVVSGEAGFPPTEEKIKEPEELEEAESVGEVEEVEEQLEEIEEEEAEELEEIEELKEPEEAQPVGEAEEPEYLEEAEPAEEAEEVEEIEEAEPEEEAEEVEELEEAEPVEEAEEAEEVEEVEEEEEVEELEEFEEEQPVEIEEEESEEAEEVEEIEELAAIDIEPLPVEVEEEELEELQTVEETDMEEELHLEKVSGGYNGYSIFSRGGPGEFNTPVNWKVYMYGESGMEDEEPASLEEIEEPATERLALEENPAETDNIKLLDKLSREKKIEYCSISDVKEKLIRLTDAIETDRNGVLQIKEEVFNEKLFPKDNQFKDLADKIIQETEKKKTSAGIETLYGGEDIELPISQVEEVRGEERNEVLPSFRDNGFDFDSLIKYFGFRHMRVMKSLRRISKSLRALSASILLSENETLKNKTSIGLDEHSRKSFLIDKKHLLYKYFLHNRMLLLIRFPIDGTIESQIPLSAEDRKAIGGCLFIPIIFEKEEAYLFLGLKTLNFSLLEAVKVFVDLSW